jgi:hypothetical protein
MVWIPGASGGRRFHHADRGCGSGVRALKKDIASSHRIASIGTRCLFLPLIFLRSADGLEVSAEVVTLVDIRLDRWSVRALPGPIADAIACHHGDARDPLSTTKADSGHGTPMTPNGLTWCRWW